MAFRKKLNEELDDFERRLVRLANDSTANPTIQPTESTLNIDLVNFVLLLLVFFLLLLIPILFFILILLWRTIN